MPRFADRFRIIATLGKYPIIRVDKGSTGTRFTIALNEKRTVTLTGDLPISCDARVGDLQTVYTEFLTEDELPVTPETEH
jgi:hypothetical protein